MKLEERIVSLLASLRDSRLLWDALGPVYDRRIHAAIAGLIDHVAAAVPLPPGARLLDVGCGPGHAALELARRNPGATVTGIDYSPTQVRAARKLQRQAKIANCAFERGDAMRLPFAASAFDAAVSIGSIKHWPDPSRGLAEIRRVLRPGGLALISETDRDATDGEIRLFMDRFRVWFVPDGLFFWGLRKVIFGRSFTRESLADALRRAGFGSVEHARAPDCPYVLARARK